MISIGPAGTFQAPRPERVEPDPDCFRLNDVWESPNGTQYRVLDVVRGKQKLMAVLQNLRTKAKVRRDWDAIGAHSSRSWVRLHCGVHDTSCSPYQ